MRQCREDVPLTRHPFRESRTLPRLMRKFQGDRPVDEPVAPFGQPHDPHAASAQFAHQPIRSDRVARAIATRRDICQIRQIRVELRKGVEVHRLVRSRGVREERTQAWLDRGVLRPEQVHPSIPFRCRLIERGIQQLIQLGPGRRVEFGAPHEQSPVCGIAVSDPAWICGGEVARL